MSDLRIIADPKKRKAVLARLRDASREASYAASAFLRWATYVEVAAIRHESGLQGDGRDYSNHPLALIRKAVSCRDTKNVFLVATAKEVLGMLDRHEVERCEQKRRDTDARRKAGGLRREVFDAFYEYLESEGIAKTESVVDDLRKQLHDRRGDAHARSVIIEERQLDALEDRVSDKRRKGNIINFPGRPSA